MSNGLETVEFVVIGSGFGGSLLATILARAGRAVTLIDRQSHPRFAIGESSTPLADRTLARISAEWRVPEVATLCSWGTWRRTRPELLCGLKRGFTYFDQTDQGPVEGSFPLQRVLVAASADDEHSDTHWLRSDVDAFIARLAVESGVRLLEDSRYRLTHDSRVGWRATGESSSGAFDVAAGFLIDASGSSSAALRTMEVEDLTAELRTNSRCVYAHWAGARRCEDMLRDSGLSMSAFPFRCDDAAVHQVLRDGWMWQLRFADDSLSAGFVVDTRPGQRGVAAKNETGSEFLSPAEEWRQRVAAVPFLSQQFAAARVVRPDSGIQRSGRIQRLAARAAGPDWAALAGTAGFIDPLHSTGIAHTLVTVERLADILLQPSPADRQARLVEYSRELIAEIRCVDELVEGCYAALPSFRLWCLWSMLYFAAATSGERPGSSDARDTSRDARRRLTGSFLMANDAGFREVLRAARQRLPVAACPGAITNRETTSAFQTVREREFADWLQAAIEPWNCVGLFDDRCDNLYSATAAPRSGD
jgi:FADH2 O2-dependent halogenase